MTTTTDTARRIYDLIDTAPRSDYGIVFAAMRAVPVPAEARAFLEKLLAALFAVGTDPDRP